MSSHCDRVQDGLKAIKNGGTVNVPSLDSGSAYSTYMNRVSGGAQSVDISSALEKELDNAEIREIVESKLRGGIEARETLIKKIAEACKSLGISEIGANDSPEEIISKVNRKMQGKQFKDSEDSFKRFCKTVADILNSTFTPGKKEHEKIINISLGDDKTCMQVSEWISAMTLGLSQDYLSQYVAIKDAVECMAVIRQIIDSSYHKLTSEMDDSQPYMSNEFISYKSVYESANSVLQQTMEKLDMLLNTYRDSDIDLLVDSTNKNSSLNKSISRVFDGPGYRSTVGSENFANMILGLSGIVTVSNLVNAAAKRLGIKVAAIADQLDTKDKLTEYIKSLEEQTTTMISEGKSETDIARFANGVDLLRSLLTSGFDAEYVKNLKDALESEKSGGRTGFNGGSRYGGKYELVKGNPYKRRFDKAQDRRKIEKKSIIKTFVSSLATAYSNLMASLDKILPYIGDTIPLSEQFDYFRNSLVRLITSDTVDIEIVLTGFSNTTVATEKRDDFVLRFNAVKRELDNLASNDQYSAHREHFNEIKAAIDHITDIVTKYSELIVTRYNYRSSSEEISELKDIVASTNRTRITLHKIVNKIVHQYYMAKFDENMRMSTKTYESDDKSNYESILGYVSAMRIKEIDQEYTKKMEISGMITNTSLKKYYSTLANVRMNLYKVAQAVDLYLREFNRAIVKNPKFVLTIMKDLDETSIISRWYSSLSGNALAASFLAHKTDTNAVVTDGKYIALMKEIVANKTLDTHIYDRIETDKIGDNLNKIDPVENAITGETNSDAMKRERDAVRSVVENVQSLKNILNAFVSIGDKISNGKLSSIMTITPVAMFKSINDYITYSAIRFDPVAWSQKFAGIERTETDFSKEDEFLCMIIKAMTSKILTILGLYDLYKREYITPTAATARMVVGGSSSLKYYKQPTIIPAAADLYFRLPRLAEYYRSILQVDSSKAKNFTVGMLPEISGPFGTIVNMIFDRAEAVTPVDTTYANKNYSSMSGDYTESELNLLITEINKLYELYSKDGKDKVAQRVINDFVTEVNKRYGILNKDEIEEYGKMRAVNRSILESRGALDTNFSILPGESISDANYVTNSRLHAPSDQWLMSDGKSSDLEHASDTQFSVGKIGSCTPDDARHVVRSFRDKFMDGLENMFSNSQMTSVNQYSELLRNVKRELEQESEQARVQTTYKLIKGLKGAHGESSKFLMMNETVLLGLNTLTAVQNALDGLHSDLIVFKDGVDHNKANINEDNFGMLIDILFVLRDAFKGMIEVDILDLTKFKDADKNKAAGQAITLSASGLYDVCKAIYDRVKKYLEIFAPFIPNQQFSLYVTYIKKLENKLFSRYFPLDEYDRDKNGAGATLDSIRQLSVYMNKFYQRVRVTGSDNDNDNAYANVVYVYKAQEIAPGSVVPAHESIDNDGNFELSKILLFDGYDSDGKTRMIYVNDNNPIDVNLGLDIDYKIKTVSEKTNSEIKPKPKPKSKLGPDDSPDIGGPSLACSRRLLYSSKSESVCASSLVSSFNELLAKYLDVFTDRSSGTKIYINLVNEFANGVASRQVNTPEQQTVDDLNTSVSEVTSGTEHTSKGFVLCRSLAVILQRLTKDVIQTSNASRHLVTTLTDIPMYMKEAYRCNLPSFKQLFKTLSDKAAFVRETLEKEMAYVTLSVKTNCLRVIKVIESYCGALIDSIDNVIRELGDDPKFLQVGENSIERYRAKNNKQPIMLMSQAAFVLNTRLTKYDVDNILKPAEGALIKPTYKYGEDGFKFMYGTRKLLLDDKQSTYKDMPGLEDMLTRYNSVQRSQDKIDASEYLDFSNAVLVILRSVNRTRFYDLPMLAYKYTNAYPYPPGTSLVGMNFVHKYNIGDSIKTSKSFGVDTHKEHKFELYFVKPDTDFVDVINTTENTNQDDVLVKIIEPVFNKKSSYNAYHDEALSIIVEMGILPLDVNALASGVPFINLINYEYTFDRFVHTIFKSVINDSDPNKRTFNYIAKRCDSETYGVREYEQEMNTNLLFMQFMCNPFRRFTQNEYRMFTKYFVGADNLRMGGRPKFISDELAGKALFLNPYLNYNSMSESIHDSNGPDVGAKNKRLTEIRAIVRSRLEEFDSKTFTSDKTSGSFSDRYVNARKGLESIYQIIGTKIITFGEPINTNLEAVVNDIVSDFMYDTNVNTDKESKELLQMTTGLHYPLYKVSPSNTALFNYHYIKEDGTSVKGDNVPNLSDLGTRQFGRSMKNVLTEIDAFRSLCTYILKRVQNATNAVTEMVAKCAILIQKASLSEMMTFVSNNSMYIDAIMRMIDPVKHKAWNNGKLTVAETFKKLFSLILQLCIMVTIKDEIMNSKAGGSSTNSIDMYYGGLTGTIISGAIDFTDPAQAYAYLYSIASSALEMYKSSFLHNDGKEELNLNLQSQLNIPVSLDNIIRADWKLLVDIKDEILKHPTNDTVLTTLIKDYLDSSNTHPPSDNPYGRPDTTFNLAYASFKKGDHDSEKIIKLHTTDSESSYSSSLKIFNTRLIRIITFIASCNRILGHKIDVDMASTASKNVLGNVFGMHLKGYGNYDNVLDDIDFDDQNGSRYPELDNRTGEFDFY